MTRTMVSRRPRSDHGSGTIRWDRIRGTNIGPAPGPARRNRGRMASDRVVSDETERSGHAGRSDGRSAAAALASRGHRESASEGLGGRPTRTEAYADQLEQQHDPD